VRAIGCISRISRVLKARTLLPRGKAIPTRDEQEEF